MSYGSSEFNGEWEGLKAQYRESAQAGGSLYFEAHIGEPTLSDAEHAYVVGNASATEVRGKVIYLHKVRTGCTNFSVRVTPSVGGDSRTTSWLGAKQVCGDVFGWGHATVDFTERYPSPLGGAPTGCVVGAQRS